MYPFACLCPHKVKVNSFLPNVCPCQVLSNHYHWNGVGKLETKINAKDVEINGLFSYLVSRLPMKQVMTQCSNISK